MINLAPISENVLAKNNDVSSPSIKQNACETRFLPM